MSQTLRDFNPTHNETVDQIKAKADDIIELIKEKCPPNREASLAITNIEQGAMWAVKSNFVKK